MNMKNELKTEIKTQNTQLNRPYLASQYLSKIIGINKAQILSESLKQISESAFHGGRIQSIRDGDIGDAYIYDLNSAYTLAQLNLPCLKHISYKESDKYSQKHKYAFYKISMNSKALLKKNNKESIYGVFPYKANNKGNLSYPIGINNIWTTSFEVNVALKHFNVTDIKIDEGYLLEPNCNHKPFESLQEMYDRKVELRKRMDPAGEELKVTLNSIYGLLFKKESKYYSPIWASFITAHIRSIITDILLKYQENIIYVNTDMVISLKPLSDIPVSNKLGDFSYIQVTDLKIKSLNHYSYINKETNEKIIKGNKG